MLFLLILFLTRNLFKQRSCVYIIACGGLGRVGTSWKSQAIVTAASCPQSLTMLREACSSRTQRDPLGSVWERSLNPPRVHKHKNGFVRGVVNAWGPRTKKTEFGCSARGECWEMPLLNTGPLSASLLTQASPSAR